MLACETGRPLIQHVYERAKECACVTSVLIATDDESIRDAAHAFGATCVMTRSDHPNGTSRIAQAVERLDVDIVVNVQGDEPEIEPRLIEAAITALQEDAEASMSTIVSPFAQGEDPANPNIVKCVVSRNRRALYFTRSLIPFNRDHNPHPSAAPLKHVGLYAYRKAFLSTFVSLAPTPLEQTEQLEQLRVLEHGYAIAVAHVVAHSQGIDTPAQYAQFVARFRSDSL